MQITWIEVENFRALKNVRLNLQEDLSLIVGRNNTGKTSVLLILEKLTQTSASAIMANDLNVDFLKKMSHAIDDGRLVDLVDQGVVLRIRIDYGDKDNIARLRPALMDLDPNNNSVLIEWRYVIDEEKISDFLVGYQKWIDVHEKKDKSPSVLKHYLMRRMRKLFSFNRYSLEVDNGEPKKGGHRNKLEASEIGRIIHFEAIRAPRRVSNVESSSALSSAAQRYYKSRREGEDGSDEAEVRLDGAFDDADKTLSEQYASIFADIISDVRRFGGIQAGESELVFQSSLSVESALKDNLRVGYADDSGDDSLLLPEWANGLGYMNLIGILMEIEVALAKMKSTESKEGSAVNLLFIEEPEAHTHPQLQRVFMRRIKSMVKSRWDKVSQHTHAAGSVNANNSLQTLVTTHSAHIVSSAEFDDIKYFSRVEHNIVVKNLSDLEVVYRKDAAERSRKKFLMHYLTVSRADILFADALVLFEGDTERILLPAMMKKYDIEHSAELEERKEAVGEQANAVSNELIITNSMDGAYLPLTSRNIALVEVGAHSQVFDSLIRFLGLRTLIITDADYKTGGENSCYVKGFSQCGNGAANHFLGDVPEFVKDSGIYVSHHAHTELIYDEIKKTWRLLRPDSDEVATLCFAIQGTAGSGDSAYTPNSFEDAFFAENRDFVIGIKDDSKSLKNIELIDEDLCPYIFAEKCIYSKPSFAMDILIHSTYEEGNPFGGWVTPRYIKEGLEWLAKS